MTSVKPDAASIASQVWPTDERHEHTEATKRPRQADQTHQWEWEYGRPPRLLGQLVDRAGAVLNARQDEQQADDDLQASLP